MPSGRLMAFVVAAQERPGVRAARHNERSLLRLCTTQIAPCGPAQVRPRSPSRVRVRCKQGMDSSGCHTPSNRWRRDSGQRWPQHWRATCPEPPHTVVLHSLQVGDVFGYWDGQRRDDGRVESAAHVEDPSAAASAYRSWTSLGRLVRRPGGRRVL